jgi:hypothetical protein
MSYEESAMQKFTLRVVDGQFMLSCYQISVCVLLKMYEVSKVYSLI